MVIWFLSCFFFLQIEVGMVYVLYIRIRIYILVKKKLINIQIMSTLLIFYNCSKIMNFNSPVLFTFKLKQIKYQQKTCKIVILII